ncbi:DUF7490 domain-containing protein [Methermicoccus shengliensis]|uniref:PGF-CTERM sorting domain-containing protein n=1 Tax=Methermicoccus shengliensis TaxID=660064 RepID=A0A832RWE3_9EURY|nr:PGF-CTERM sorting domain-containing protein [Methermicoccus shengliensis]KUK05147.1 MAG: hypothetical protein XD46_0140 [Euryarchaeota archaeon 55_53]KUK30713.1 MAG: hypothetical protein XD62_0222 [Methanosarcinales archeaon 56_1174]MDI3487307.1 hypothetical protein [Methanosarcinales archaeon]MDN5294619.1 hypothetical protein [Methanosarcinales archaeon]HIH69327.1 hypothetical protein [Methermicoccus shengliensis]
MKGRIVAISIAVIFAIAIILPFLVNVSGEQKVEHIQINNIEIKAKKVNESHADIEFILTVYRSKVVSNATLIVSVYDKRTNLLLQKYEIEVLREGKEGLNEMNVTVAFEKDKDYNIAFEIRKDNKIVSSRGMSLKGLDTLLPKDKELKMTLKDADFKIVEVSGNKAVVKTRFYIETMENYDDTVFHIKAIQYESNVLAAEKWLEIEIKKGKTLLVESNLTVPKDYNYLVKLEVWRNGSLLKSWSKVLNLAPTKRIPENVTEEGVKFEVSQFVKPEGAYETPPTPVPTPIKDYGDKVGMPGFEAALGIIALGGALIWRRLR